MATTFAVPDGRVAMNTVLRNGFGTSGDSITSLNFQPDFIWEKRRNVAVGNHFLVDSVRGATKTLSSNITSVEATYNNYFISFNSNGYSLGVGDYTSTDSLVDWCWKAGGTAVSNTAGTITSSVSANPTAGFSVVTYTQGVTNGTVGHGLGVTPGLIIVKSRTQAFLWPVYHTSVGKNAEMVLNSTAAANIGNTNYWGVVGPNSTTFGVGIATSQYNNYGDLVAYCWAPVAGYSAFGSYTGNGSADGPFVYTGFRPRWLMIKRTDYVSGYGDWYIWDSARNTYNSTNSPLSPNTAGVENANNSSLAVDTVSNGFKLRAAYQDINNSGTTCIYAAFAENPLKYSNAR